MSEKLSFFAELKRRNVIPMDYADDSITLFDLRTRWNGTRLETTRDFRKSQSTAISLSVGEISALVTPDLQRVCVGRRVPSTQSFSILF